MTGVGMRSRLPRDVEPKLPQPEIEKWMLGEPGDIGSAVCRRHGLRHLKNHL